MKQNVVLTIAKYSILESIRDKFFLFILIGLFSIIVLSLFVSNLTITETLETKIAVFCAISRFFLVFAISLFSITSMLRESENKGLELLLSHSFPRALYYIGKLCGYAFISLFFCVLVSCFLCIHIQSIDVLFWSFSLWCELLIILSFSLFCLISLNNVTISFSLAMCFYILSRSMEIIYLVSNSPIISGSSIFNQSIIYLLEAIFYLIPDLYRFTQVEWLIYGAVESNYIYLIFGQTLIYVFFLSCMGIFELYKKEL